MRKLTLETDPGWEPTEAQERLLEVFQSHDYRGYIKDHVQEADLAKGQFHKWMRRDHNFCRWWIAEQEKFFARNLNKVYQRMYAMATGASKGSSADVKAAKLFIERFDKRYAPRRKHFLAPGESEADANRDALELIDKVLLSYPEETEIEAETPQPQLPEPEDD